MHSRSTINCIIRIKRHEGNVKQALGGGKLMGQVSCLDNTALSSEMVYTGF